jgi:hypothetical protein
MKETGTNVVKSVLDLCSESYETLIIDLNKRCVHRVKESVFLKYQFSFN